MKGKAMVAWEKICLPKSAGGLNVTDMITWSKAALLKQLWSIYKKKERLWILWVHEYYMKGKMPWETKVNQAAWIIRKILQATKY